MSGLATTPASNHLFNTDPGCTKLGVEKGHLFHHLVQKLLYLCKHTRQDIQTAVAFLCTRVRDPDTDDYKKLTKVMQYIRNTRSITLTIEPTDVPKWWVDSSYAVHPDMSHTGTWHSEKELPSQDLVNKNWTLKVLQRLNWWLWMTRWGKYCGPDISYQHRAFTYLPWQYTRQHEHYTVGRKWKILKFKENSANKHTVLLCDRPSKKGIRKNRILSYWEHARGFLYKTTTGKCVQKYV